MNSSGDGVGQPVEEIRREGVASLLAIARQRFNEGNPSLALQAVVIALRTIGGEQAVISALGRAREVYENGVHANEATDELTALFAQCAIATTIPPSAPVAPQHVPAATSSQVEMMESNRRIETSILAESGRQQVVWDASSDGSSFLCQQCGGVVSNSRRDEHIAYWCSSPLSNRM